MGSRETITNYDFGNRQKVIVAVTAPKGWLVRHGGDYAVEITSGADFGEAAGATTDASQPVATAKLPGEASQPMATAKPPAEPSQPVATAKPPAEARQWAEAQQAVAEFKRWQASELPQWLEAESKQRQAPELWQWLKPELRAEAEQLRQWAEALQSATAKQPVDTAQKAAEERQPKLRSAVLEGHSDSVETVAFSSDQQMLASGSDDTTIKLWTMASGRELKTLNCSHAVYSVAFSPDGHILASGYNIGTVELWDVAGSRTLHSLRHGDGPVKSVAFSPDGKTLASMDIHYILKFWDVASGTELHPLGDHLGNVASFAFSPDRRTIALGGRYKMVKLWDLVSGREAHALKGSVDDQCRSALVYPGTDMTCHISYVAFSKDGYTLASATEDIVNRWDPVRGLKLGTLKGSFHVPMVSPDLRTLAWADADTTVRLWDLASRMELHVLTHLETVLSLAFSPDGRVLASGHRDKTVRLWDVTTGNLVLVPK